MLKIIKNTTDFEQLKGKKYLLYLNTGLSEIYESLTLKGLIRYIIWKLRH